MGQYSRGTTVIYTPSIVAVFVCMLTLSFIVAPRTQALSLDPVLNTVTVVTKTVSGDDKEVKSSRSSSSQSQNSQRSGASTTTPVSPSPSASTSEAVVPASEEIIVAEPLQELPTIEGAVVTSSAPPIRPIKAVAASAEVVGVQPSITPLQATEQGWKLFGVAWYWLGIVGATFWGGFMYIQRYYLNLSRSRLLPLLLRTSASQGEA